MPKKRIHTKRGLNLSEGNRSATESAASLGDSKMNVAHIPGLPKSDATLIMLQRIHREFFSIVEGRGFRVISISEMCCCGDGLDHGVTLSTTKRQKRRKRKIMASNVLGYNQTSIGRGGKSHAIHLRLRNAQNHNQFLSYEEVAGTMAHEIAHCVHGAHNAAFYKLMDEIQEQHAVILARGIVPEGIPMGKGYVLGGGKNGQSAASAAEARRQKFRWMPQGPQKLGGDDSFKKWLTPGEAAAAAAEIRRRQDERWCLPCGEPYVIDLLESDSKEDPEKTEVVVLAGPGFIQFQDNEERLKAQASNIMLPTFTFAQASTEDTINLTEERNYTPKATADTSDPGWVCNACTFRNSVNQILVCEICRTEKSSATKNLISKKKRDDKVQRIKEREVEKSRKDFGFNIYGIERKKSATMSHIT